MYIKSEIQDEKNEQQNNKFNCFLVCLLSHIRSCFLWWTWNIFHAAVIHSEMYFKVRF